MFQIALFFVRTLEELCELAPLAVEIWTKAPEGF
jgi:hypothetical protein